MGGTPGRNQDILSPRSARRQQCAAAAEARFGQPTSYLTTLTALNGKSGKQSVTPEVLALLQLPNDEIERIRADLARKVEGLKPQEKSKTIITLEEAVALTPSVSEYCIEDIAALELIYFSVKIMKVSLEYGDIERQRISCFSSFIDHSDDSIPLDDYALLIYKACDYLLAPRNLAYIDTPDDDLECSINYRESFFRSLHRMFYDLKKTFDIGAISNTPLLFDWAQDKKGKYFLNNDKSCGNESIKQRLVEIKALVRDIIKADKQGLIAYSPKLADGQSMQNHPSKSNLRRILKCFACDIVSAANSSANQARRNAVLPPFENIKPIKWQMTRTQKEGYTELGLTSDTSDDIDRLVKELKAAHANEERLNKTFRLGIPCPRESSPSRMRPNF